MREKRTRRKAASLIPLPADISRFTLPDGFERLDADKYYRIYLRATYPEIEPQCLLVRRMRPRDLREHSWRAVRQQIDRWLRQSVKYEVLMVRESDSGKIVAEEYPLDFELDLQEQLRQVAVDEAD